MKYRTLNEISTSLFIEELVRQGVTDVFIAPGSRSTPLVLACNENIKMKVHTHFDERGLGFFALGFAKKTNRPTLIITTSGTAVANLLPAVVEAYNSQTPLIVCTADRPSELINVGANQAIVQKDIFHNFTCENFEISPVDEKTPLESLLTIAGHSVFRALTENSPVHINWMFREPLVPTQNLPPTYELSPQLKTWWNSKKPYSLYLTPQIRTVDMDLTPIRQSSKILVIFGSHNGPAYKDALFNIAEKLDSPVFCDVQNPLRFENFPQNILRFDLLLDLIQFDKPDMILHIGGPLTSKKLNQYIEKYDGPYIQIHDSNRRLDFMHKTKTLIRASANDFSLCLSSLPLSTEGKYLEDLKTAAELLEQPLKDKFRNLNEMSLPYHLVANATNVNFFFGSSMPIRDLERFASTGKNQEFLFNRGASGIDGNIATAVGSSIASEAKTICVLGDQAFLYDVNSLALVHQSPNVFHTIVVNNQGGGIFAFLPVAKIDKDQFNKNFTHPHEWTLKAAADMFHLKYVLVKSPEELLAAIDSPEHSIIEVKTDIETNVKEHRQLTNDLKKIYD